MLPLASVDDNVVTCHSAEHPCGASALRGLAFPPVFFEYIGAPYRIVGVAPPPKRLTMVYWRGEQFFLGKFLDHPEIMTQGETLEELEENLKDAYLAMVLEDVPDNYQTKELAL